MNYRELFERLAKCNLPAGVSVDVLVYPPHEVDVCTPLASMCAEINTPHECRAALMLIVDAMRAEGWAFTFEDSLSRRGGVDFNVTAYFPTGGWVQRSNADQVTAIAECLIAALGVAE